jgi:hypothetical protein
MSPSIAVALRKASERVREWLASKAIERVTEQDFSDLVRTFPEIKARTLRQALRESGLNLAAMVDGVRQDSLLELARTLSALQNEYQAAADDPPRQRRIRSLVIESKAHARFASARKPEKQEMVEWMLVWLQDPSLFDTWARLRLRSIGELGADRMPEPHARETDQH